MNSSGYIYTPPVEEETDVIPTWNVVWIPLLLAGTLFIIIFMYCKWHSDKKPESDTEAELRTSTPGETPTSPRRQSHTEYDHSLEVEERALTDLLHGNLFEDEFTDNDNELSEIVTDTSSSFEEETPFNATAIDNQVTPPPMYHEIEGTMVLVAPPTYSEFMASPYKYTKVS